MISLDWRDRLQQALDTSGKSAREVSLAAGKGPGYVHSLLKAERDPTIENLLAVCNALEISLSWLIYGYQVSPETEEILSLLEGAPSSRDAILQILRDRKPA